MKIDSITRNIVNQILDEAEVPAEKRQQINDKCDEFVQELLEAELLDAAKWRALISIKAK